MTVRERVDTAQRRVVDRLHPLAGPIVVAAATVVAATYVHQIDPNVPGHYPTCPSLWLTGWYCPGCGSLRAGHDLTHLDLAGAWAMNPALVLVAPWLVWRWIAWVAAVRGRPIARRPAPAWALYGLAGLVVVYWVARNIPAWEPFLAP
jgi:hypothetical protein